MFQPSPRSMRLHHKSKKTKNSRLCNTFSRTTCTPSPLRGEASRFTPQNNSWRKTKESVVLLSHLSQRQHTAPTSNTYEKCHLFQVPVRKVLRVRPKPIVETTGLEPVTSRKPSRRATNCATSPKDLSPRERNDKR